MRDGRDITGYRPETTCATAGRWLRTGLVLCLSGTLMAADGGPGKKAEDVTGVTGLRETIEKELKHEADALDKLEARLNQLLSIGPPSVAGRRRPDCDVKYDHQRGFYIRASGAPFQHVIGQIALKAHLAAEMEDGIPESKLTAPCSILLRDVLATYAVEAIAGMQGLDYEVTERAIHIRSPQSRTSLGKQHYAKHLEDRAARAYMQALGIYPECPSAHEARYRHAKIRFDRQDFAVARYDFEMVTNDYPDSPYAWQARYMIARCSEELGEFERARNEYEKLLLLHKPKERLADEVLHALEAIGGIYQKQEGVDYTVRYYDAILAADDQRPYHLAARRALVRLHLEQKQYEAALTELGDGDLSEFEHLQTSMLFDRGLSHQMLGRYEEALVAYRTALDHGKPAELMDRCRLALGDCLLGQENALDACETFQALCREIEADHAEVVRDLPRSCEALTPDLEGEEGLRRMSIYFDALLGRTRAYQALALYGRAGAECRAILKKLPLDDRERRIRAQMRRAECHYALGQFNEALRVFLLVSRDTDDPQLQGKLSVRVADCLYRAGRHQEAIEKYEALREAHQENLPLLGDILKRLGDCYAKLGRVDDAAQAYEAAAKARPSTDQTGG